MTARTSWTAAGALLIASWPIVACGPPAASPPARPAALQLPETPRGLANADPEVRVVVEELLAAVRAQPDSARAWGALGDRYAANSWLTDAAAAYRRAAELDPGAFDWPYRLGQALVTLDPAAATQAFRAAVRLDPGYGPAQIYLGRQLASSGELEEAERRLARASELEPNNAYAPLVRGRVALQRGEPERAIEFFREAIRRQPRHGEAHQALAQALGGLGRDAEAWEHAETARRVPLLASFRDPRMANLAPPIGVAARLREVERLEALGDLAGIEAQLRAILRYSPGDAEAHRKLGLVELRHGDEASAEAELREAVRLNPDSVINQAGLAEFLLGRGRKREAIPPLEAALELRPGGARVRGALADALASAGFGERAWSVLCEGLDRGESEDEPLAPLLDLRARWDAGAGPPGACAPDGPPR